ncbi:MAG: M28 family peptidase [Nocardioides sp.]|jgi:aminopeptidase YwaD
MSRLVAALLCAVAATNACGGETPESNTPAPSSSPSARGSVATSDPSPDSPPSEASTSPPAAVRSEDFDAGVAYALVRTLAVEIGPREATSPAYDRAAELVSRRLSRAGYAVRRQQVRVPAGNSWGVPVPAGHSENVIAEPPGFDPDRPYLVVGAHLDTVPTAPGAEDNASGIGVLVAAAEAVVAARTRLPVVWVAFGAEEPRGAGDEAHHYGSRAYVGALVGLQRDSVRAMVSLDRVGVGNAVPVGSAGETDPVQRRLLRLADRIGVSAAAESGQRSSDHWSFVRAGLPGVRLGGTSYAGYHSAEDLPHVVSRAQLDRVGRLLLAWLR